VFETQKQQNFRHRTSYDTSFMRHSFRGGAWAQQVGLLSAVWLRGSVGWGAAPASRGSWVRVPLGRLGFSGSRDGCLDCPAGAGIVSSFDS